MVVRYKSTSDILDRRHESEDIECKLRLNPPSSESREPDDATCKLLQMTPLDTRDHNYYYEDEEFTRQNSNKVASKWHSCKFLGGHEASGEDEKSSYYKKRNHEDYYFHCNPISATSHQDEHDATRVGRQHCKSAIDFQMLGNSQEPEVGSETTTSTTSRREMNLSDVVIVKSPTINLSGGKRTAASSRQLKQLKRQRRNQQQQQRRAARRGELSSQLAISSPTLRLGGAIDSDDDADDGDCRREDCCVRTSGAGNDTVRRSGQVAGRRRQQVAVNGDAAQLDERQRRQSLDSRWKTKDLEGMASLAYGEAEAAVENFAKLAGFESRQRVEQQWHRSEQQLNPAAEADSSRQQVSGASYYGATAAATVGVAQAELRQQQVADDQVAREKQQVAAVAAAASTEGQPLDSRRRANSMANVAAKDAASFKLRDQKTTNGQRVTTQAASCGQPEMAIVDLNSVTSQLVAGACKLSPWRQHSASYRVAQEHEKQQVETGGAKSREQQQQQMSSANSSQQVQIQGRENETLATAIATEVSRPATEVATRSHRNHVTGNKSRHQSRQTRPGRSPISLQRETSARLARHRLKIQQQRQEQLASLALRERQQLGLVYQSHLQAESDHTHHSRPQVTSNHRHSTSNRGQAQQAADRNSTIINFEEAERIDYEDYDENSTSGERRRRSGEQTTRNNQSILGSIFNFIWPRESEAINSVGQTQLGQFYTNSRARGRINLRRGGQRSYRLATRQSSRQRNRATANQATSATSPARNSASNPSRAIEICDIQQQAAASGGSEANSLLRLAARNSDTRGINNSTSANVFVFRSIDMLRNSGYGGQTGSSRGQNHNQESQALKDSQDMDLDDADAKTICSSASSLSLNRPFCKICHLGSSKNGDKLISPCKCSGTMQYIHCGCLLKWLEISNRTNEKPMSCELCAHEYTWHKRFNYKQMQFPRCSLKDMFLHLVFVGAICSMFFCALAPILSKKPQDTQSMIATVSSSQLTSSDHQASRSSQEPSQRHSSASSSNGHHQPTTFRHGTFAGYSNHMASSRLAHDEKFMILCAGFFFMSFFLAIYVQTKARDTLYGLVAKFLNMNQTYYITEYDHGQLQQHSPATDGNSNNLNINSNSENSNPNIDNRGKPSRHQQQQQQQQQQPPPATPRLNHGQEVDPVQLHGQVHRQQQQQSPPPQPPPQNHPNRQIKSSSLKG